MNARKLCGQHWESPCNPPDSHHWCTRPVGHPGMCACKCGAWRRAQAKAGASG